MASLDAIFDFPNYLSRFNSKEVKGILRYWRPSWTSSLIAWCSDCEMAISQFSVTPSTPKHGRKHPTYHSMVNIKKVIGIFTVLVAVLDLTSFRQSDFDRFLVLYAPRPIISETVEKNHFLSIIWGRAVIFQILT